eukprot:CAMPEP_0180139212 /NCGR_PEP_ID=MMETSP0986-20121125/13396_1 /TAXON_ID=697907 /ORGANISM="non described non described, Strain CCMP2293" /LENGTH=61 /DNA_ID=CAMNT_0022081267 /DNA_START=100 /DNA_END=282 /DNA_ORIENTATION=+
MSSDLGTFQKAGPECGPELSTTLESLQAVPAPLITAGLCGLSPLLETLSISTRLSSGATNS